MWVETDVGTYFDDTWDTGLWQSPALSTRGYSAGVLVNKTAWEEKQWKGNNNKPCESCDRICQTLETHAPHGQLDISCHGRTALGCRLTQAAFVARIFASRTCAIKVDLADAADIVFREIPSPSRDGVPLFDFDLHVDCFCLFEFPGLMRA